MLAAATSTAAADGDRFGEKHPYSMRNCILFFPNGLGIGGALPVGFRPTVAQRDDAIEHWSARLVRAGVRKKITQSLKLVAGLRVGRGERRFHQRVPTHPATIPD